MPSRDATGTTQVWSTFVRLSHWLVAAIVLFTGRKSHAYRLMRDWAIRLPALIGTRTP